MAINAQGARLWFWNGSDWLRLEEVVSIGGPDGSANLIDTSHLRSLNKEYLPGLADAGTVTIACNFKGGTVQMALRTMFKESSDPAHFRIDVPKTARRTDFFEFYFDACVTKWATSQAVDSKVPLNITLQSTGGMSGEDSEPDVTPATVGWRAALPIPLGLYA